MMKNLLSRFLCLSILLLNASLVWAQTTATVLVKIGVKKAGLEPSAYLTDFATAAEQMAAEVVGDILPSEYQTRVSTHSTACPAGESAESYPGKCWDAAIKLTFQVVKAESTAKAEEIEETFSLYVTNGRLAEILTAVNADSPVVIFELIVPGEPTSSPIKAPASPPPEKIQVEERVLVQVGLEESGLSTAVYIDDLVQSVKQLALEVLDGLGTVGMQLQVELATGVCPNEASFVGGCQDATVIFTLEVSGGDNTETVKKVIRETLPSRITEGRLQQILDGVNAESLVTILSVMTAPPAQSPTIAPTTETPKPTTETLKPTINEGLPDEQHTGTERTGSNKDSAADRMQYSILLFFAIVLW